MAALTHGAAAAEPGHGAEIQFNRDVRPILSDHCFHCHGPDPSSRKAKLRLDVRAEAIAPRGDNAPIAPGDPDASTLIHRIRSENPDEIMPPPETKKPLSPAQIATLEAWIRAGAPYEGHWAYEPIRRPEPPPAPKHPGWSSNAIDRFIAARLSERNLEPSPPADARVLYRRLSLDLTGLPPAPSETDAFAADPSPKAYARAVERFLESRHFGERMAVFWLDLVRYADTVGYHGDQPYSVWPYRDYVIRAFNANMPFHQFTVENLAGDLLNRPTRDQLVASGYNRLLMITAEGGAQDREYLAKYAADRVRNASTVWMGVTLGCAECHDHKYDPFTTRDFYSFAAFFSDLKEKGFYNRGYPAGDWGPSLELPDVQQAATRARLDRRIAELEAELATTTPDLAAAQARWEESLTSTPPPAMSPWRALGPFTAPDFDAAFNRDFGPEKNLDLAATHGEGALAWTEKGEWKDEAVIALPGGDNAVMYLHREIQSDTAQDLALSLGSDDAIKVWLNGERVLASKAQRAAAPDQETPVLKLRPGRNTLLLKIVNASGGHAFYFRAIGMAPGEIVRIAGIPGDERVEEQREKIAAYFRSVTPLLDGARKELESTRAELAALIASIPTTLISERRDEPRMTRVLRRGNWLDDGGEIVEPAVPHFLPRAGLPDDRRLTRRDLAEWLISDENPLTARVFVNRLWKQFFGTGLSKNLEDIGAQGEWPSHPKLLDWLASEFRDSGWNVKHMVRLMVTSATYRQSSVASPRLREIDPDNRLLARQSAFRLDAEFVRDSALAISGLLVDRLGGPSARPYQPAGYYSQLNFPRREYEPDTDSNQYRRGLYTHWQRTFLHPSLAAFDAPTREECTAERVRSNTPQQALVLLNDPTYVEAARAFAERILRQGGDTTAARIEFALREALGRPARPAEIDILRSLHDSHARDYSANPEAAAELLGIGLRPVPPDLPHAELAAWTSVARAILNLHEMITRA